MTQTTKRTFRTLYDNKGYSDPIVKYEPSVTDPSGYVPTEQLIARFQRGEILHATTGGTYSVDEHTTDDEAFNNDEAEQKLETELSQLSENEVEARLAQIRLKIKTARNTPPKPPVVPSPTVIPPVEPSKA